MPTPARPARRALALATALLALAGCAGSAGPAQPPVRGGPGVVVDGRTIYVSALLPLTGPQAGVGRAVAAGLQAFLGGLDASGGIGGWQIDLTMADTAGSPQRALAQFRRLAPETAFVAASLGGAAADAIGAAARSEPMVVEMVSQDSRFMRQQLDLLVGPPYRVEAENALAYLSAGGQHRGIRVAIAYQGGGYGADSLAGYRAAVSPYHLNDAAEVQVGGDAGGAVRALQRARAGYVLLATDPARTAAVFQAARRLGYHPQWILENPAWSAYQITADGLPGGPVTPLAGQLAGAWVVGFDAPWGDVTLPGTNPLFQQLSQYAAPGTPIDQYVVYGYCLGMLARALVNTAITDGDLSRAGLVVAKGRLGATDFAGLVPPGNYATGGGIVSRLSEISRIDPQAPGFLDPLTPFFEGTVAAGAGLG